MLFTFSSQLTTTDRSRPSQTPFLIDLLSTFNMSSTTKTVDLNISARTISNVPRILYVLVYLFSKQNKKDY